MTLLGEAGLTRLARINHATACKLADALAAVPGVSVLNDAFFNEFTVRLPGPAAETIEKLAERGVLAGVPVSRLEPDSPDLANLMVVAATETVSDADIATYAAALAEVV
jgi:glycine dehydrogenase subunit 1